LRVRLTERALCLNGLCVGHLLPQPMCARKDALLRVGMFVIARRYSYSLDTLIARHGPGFGIPELLRRLSDDCPKRQSLSAYDLCGVHCPDLPHILSRLIASPGRPLHFMGQRINPMPENRLSSSVDRSIFVFIEAGHLARQQMGEQ
jgi:hypothetical protein